MTSPSISPAPTSRRDAAIELAVVLGASIALRSVLASNSVKAWLPAMPVIKHAWVLFLFTIAILLWLRRRHGGNVAEFGVRPFAPWRRILVIGVLGAVISVVIDVLTGPIVRAAFGKPELQRLETIENNLPVYLMLIVAAFVFGGIGEELLYRGIILTRLHRLFGPGRAALAAALILQGVIFGLVHSYQGASGMISIAILGIMDGLIFVTAGSNLWAPAISHGLIDTLGFTLLFLGVMKS